MLMLLRRMGVEGVTVHGFRSTFRDWASEVANAPREVAEMSLSHKVGSDVERAYARSDLLGRRRLLMERWSEERKSARKVTFDGARKTERPTLGDRQALRRA
jgi:integrase